MSGNKELAKAWEQGWLAAYYSDRGYKVAELGLPIPEHLTEDIVEWNPYRRSEGEPNESA